MDEFLESLSRSQLNKLQDILNEEISGDIDYFLFCIDRELDNRNKPIYNPEINEYNYKNGASDSVEKSAECC